MASKVTAIVSAYYAEQYMKQRLDNLLEQKPQPEIIVCCQYGSEEQLVAEEYGCKIVSTKNIPTLGTAWNKCIKQSEGDYIITANTDDLFKPGAFATMARVLDEHPEIGLVFSSVDRREGAKTESWQRIRNDTGEVENIKTILEAKSIIGPMPMWRKSLHDSIGYFNDKFMVVGDYDMWKRMVLAGTRFWYIRKALGIYEKRDDSLEHRRPDIHAKEKQIVRGR